MKNSVKVATYAERIEDIKREALGQHKLSVGDIAKITHRNCVTSWDIRTPEGDGTRSFKEAPVWSVCTVHNLYGDDDVPMAAEQWEDRIFLKVNESEWVENSEAGRLEWLAKKAGEEAERRRVAECVANRIENQMESVEILSNLYESIGFLNDFFNSDDPEIPFRVYSKWGEAQEIFLNNGLEDTLNALCEFCVYVELDCLPYRNRKMKYIAAQCHSIRVGEIVPLCNYLGMNNRPDDGTE